MVKKLHLKRMFYLFVTTITHCCVWYIFCILVYYSWTIGIFLNHVLHAFIAYIIHNEYIINRSHNKYIKLNHSFISDEWHHLISTVAQFLPSKSGTLKSIWHHCWGNANPPGNTWSVVQWLELRPSHDLWITHRGRAAIGVLKKFISWQL